MVRKVTYVNKTTREISPTLNHWIENLTDPVDKEACMAILMAEVEHEQTPGNPPLLEYVTLFERYFAENNIEIILTDE